MPLLSRLQSPQAIPSSRFETCVANGDSVCRPKKAAWDTSKRRRQGLELVNCTFLHSTQPWKSRSSGIRAKKMRTKHSPAPVCVDGSLSTAFLLASAVSLGSALESSGCSSRLGGPGIIDWLDSHSALEVSTEKPGLSTVDSMVARMEAVFFGNMPDRSVSVEIIPTPEETFQDEDALSRDKGVEDNL